MPSPWSRRIEVVAVGRRPHRWSRSGCHPQLHAEASASARSADDVDGPPHGLYQPPGDVETETRALVATALARVGLAEGVEEAIDDGPYVHDADRDPERAGLDPSRVEKVLDQSFQPLTLDDDAVVHVLALGGREPLSLNRKALREADHRGERRP